MNDKYRRYKYIRTGRASREGGKRRQPRINRENKVWKSERGKLILAGGQKQEMRSL